MRPGFFPLVLAVLGLLASGPVAAQPRRDPGVLPLDRILPGVRATHPGQFYDADGPTPGPDGSEHYHLKWMAPDGRIEWLDTDARTGRVLNSAPGRDAFDGPGGGRNFAPAPSFPTPPAFEERFQDRREFRQERPDPRAFRQERPAPRELRQERPWRGGGGEGYGGQRGRRGR